MDEEFMRTDCRLADTLLAGNYYISEMIKRKDDRNMGTCELKRLSSEENRTRQGVRNPNYWSIDS